MTNANRKRQLAVETAAKEGLRASVPLYIAAAEAFAQEDRPAQGVELLGELLNAKERRRGLFGRAEKNPLGTERLRVATKYAELARTTSPTEDSLEMLEDLSIEFSESPAIRRANADGLRNAGYAADAIEEYQYCARLEPEDGDIEVRMSELFAALGRTDEAIDSLRKGIAQHAASGEYEQVADRAMRFIDLNPDDLEDVYMSLELLPGEVLKRHVPSLDHIGILVRRDPSKGDEWRARMEQRLVDLYTLVLEIDGRNAAARRGINVLGQQYMADVEVRLKAAAQKAQAAATPAPAPATPTPETPAPKPAVASAPATPAPAAATVAPASATPAPAPATPAPATPAPTPPATPAAAAAPPPAATPYKPAPAAASPELRSGTTAPPPPAPPPPAAPARAEAAEVHAPELVEKSPGELVAEETPVVAAAVPVAAAGDAGAQTPAAAPASGKGLYAFALRKAQEQFDAGSYDAAAQACDRILKRGDIPEVLQLLMACYVKLERKPDAVAAGLRYAESLAAESPAKALEALTEMIKTLPDAALVLRRSQLLTNMRQVEFAGKKG